MVALPTMGRHCTSLQNIKNPILDNIILDLVSDTSSVKEENHKIRRQGQGQRDGATFCFLETRVVVEVIVVLALATFCDVGLQDFCFSFNRLCSSFDLCASLNFCLSSTTSTQFRRNVFTIDDRDVHVTDINLYHQHWVVSSAICGMWNQRQSSRKVLAHFVTNMHISYYASWSFFLVYGRWANKICLWFCE